MHPQLLTLIIFAVTGPTKVNAGWWDGTNTDDGVVSAVASTTVMVSAAATTSSSIVSTGFVDTVVAWAEVEAASDPILTSAIAQTTSSGNTIDDVVSVAAAPTVSNAAFGVDDSNAAAVLGFNVVASIATTTTVNAAITSNAVTTTSPVDPISLLSVIAADIVPNVIGAIVTFSSMAAATDTCSSNCLAAIGNVTDAMSLVQFCANQVALMNCNNTCSGNSLLNSLTAACTRAVPQLKALPVPQVTAAPTHAATAPPPQRQQPSAAIATFLDAVILVCAMGLAVAVGIL